MEEIIDYYSSFDEWGRLDREPLEFNVNLHYIQSNLPIAGHILDNGAGPGKYAMELAKLGYQITLSDLTPRLVEVAEAKAGELGLIEQFASFLVQDARNLSKLESNQFDASLMLGASVTRVASCNEDGRPRIRCRSASDNSASLGIVDAYTMEAARSSRGDTRLHAVWRV
ncbi:class I SAM-dependent methyltransferase [Paenibacillus sp. OV219]|uniref:class I SAM-dependent methyltransferase n=1 Tax=Paenibacillus sp. OV219 TaxID=1884377 RepID=UPI0008B82CCA|nr:Methyltransferase domain-containing protein [Paenibacillus sp. OV219]